MSLTDIFEKVRNASRSLLQLHEHRVNEILCAVADEAMAQCEEILSANADDLARMSPCDPKYDRLRLTKERLEGIAADMRKVAELPSPLGRVLKETT